MAQIIGPDGRSYYTADHNHTGSHTSSETSKKIGNAGETIMDYLTLIGGILALLIALYLLADIAIGLILLFVGSTSINYWMMKRR